MSRQCPFYPESGLCWRRSPDTLVATHLGLARSRYRSPIYFRSPGLPSTLCSRGLFFQCAIAGATHHKPGLRCLAVAFRQAACSTRVSISLRSIPKSIGLVKFGLPLLHHAMRRTLAGNGQAIELAGAAKSEISIISRTSPRPSEAILPASIITRRPSSSLGRSTPRCCRIEAVS